MSLHPKIIDLTLDRVWRLLSALDNPHQRLSPVIHIAGTNGKGSTQAMIRAGLEAAGSRVQAYTSPHLARFHERIRLGSGLICEAALAETLAECEAANHGVPITYFEITTIAAMLAFARDPADFCLMEVGLGGRLDATNVFAKPRLTIITPVSIDHQQYLGDTIEEIAFEKAGILKPGTLGVIGPQSDAALDVITTRADAIGAPLSVYGQDWMVWEEHGRLAFQDNDGLLDLPLPALIGAHQVQNAGTAIAALRALGADETAIRAAMTGVNWPARMQRLRVGPLVSAAPDCEIWLDGGHNPAAGAALAEALARLPARPTHAICGMLNTKDLAGYFAPLAERVGSLVAVPIPDAPATLPADKTAAAAIGSGIPATTAPDVMTALKQIRENADNPRILICGSLYLAGNVLKDNS